MFALRFVFSSASEPSVWVQKAGYAVVGCGSQFPVPFRSQYNNCNTQCQHESYNIYNTSAKLSISFSSISRFRCNSLALPLSAARPDHYRSRSGYREKGDGELYIIYTPRGGGLPHYSNNNSKCQRQSFGHKAAPFSVVLCV